MIRWLGDPRVALVFLTRLPVTARAAGEAGALSRAAPWFPVVGVLVGATLGGVRLLAELALPAGPATLLGIAAAIVLTGALHEDGLADAADGLGAHVARERRLEIMRDSRVGTFGALALLLSVGLSWSLLASLSATDCLGAAIVAHVAARWSMVVTSWGLHPAEGAGKGRMLRAAPGAALLTTVVAGALAAVVGGPAWGLAALAAAGVVALGSAAAMARALGGVTGDVYGALGKAAELTALVTLVAAWG